MITLSGFLWAVAAGMALGLAAIFATRLTGTPAGGWLLLGVVFAAACAGAARARHLGGD